VFTTTRFYQAYFNDVSALLLAHGRFAPLFRLDR
jgi:hypothetical protein